jgi:hypothetical protein
MQDQYTTQIIDAIELSVVGGNTESLTKANHHIQMVSHFNTFSLIIIFFHQVQTQNECVPALMSIIMQPADLQKRQSIHGGPIKSDDVY